MKILSTDTLLLIPKNCKLAMDNKTSSLNLSIQGCRGLAILLIFASHALESTRTRTFLNALPVNDYIDSLKLRFRLINKS